MKAYKKILITGTSGFLGGRVAKFLPSVYPAAQILCTSRKATKQPELEAAGCTFIAGDLADKGFCQNLLRQTDAVVHCAALSSPWGKYEDFEKANVQVTQNLLEAAVANGVKRFVFISTPSIYFDYTDRLNITEQDALPAQMVNAYAETKYKAEQLVLAANSPALETLALRPRAIIGAEDTVIFPRVIKAYQEKKLSILGNGNNIVDLTCVRNVIEAIVCALEAPTEATGRGYNITNDEPVKLWDQVNYVLIQLGLQPVIRKLPYGLVKAFAAFTELHYRWFRPGEEPPITRYGIGILAVSMTMNNSLARHNLGYKPVQTTKEGIDEFIAWYKQK